MARDGWRTRLTSTALVSAIHGSPQLRTRQLRQRYTGCEATGVRADGDIIGNRNRPEQFSAGSNVDAVPDGWRRVGQWTQVKHRW